MFGNKKNNLPPRPNLPDAEHMLEDLRNAAVDDVAFKITNKGDEFAECPTSVNFDVYQNVKVYLNIKQQLKHLETTVKKTEEQLQTDNEEIRKLANDIRKQAEAALIT